MQEKQETQILSLGWKDPLEKEMAAHSSILAWEIPEGYSPWGHKESGTTEHACTMISVFNSVQFSRSVMSSCLWLHGLQHARLPCPSPTSGAYSNSCPSNQWCHPTISSSVIPFSSRLFPSIRVFSNESVLLIRWPKYWSFSFSISPSNEYSRLISFRMDWLDLLAVQGTLKSLLQPHSSKASILQCSAFFIFILLYLYIIWLYLYIILFVYY